MAKRAAGRWAVLAVLSGALAVISLDNTVLNVALPSLQEDLDATTSEVQWIVDAYSVFFAGSLLIAGSLGDRFGRRRALVIGLVVFGAASLAAGFAPDALTLSILRAVMGVGGAFIMPSTLSILAQVFTEPRERVQAIGIWSAVAGAAVGLGPIIGGLLVEYVSWHAVFWINPPLCLVLVVAVYAIVPESRDPAEPRLDPVGAILSIIGLVALVVTVIELPDSGIDVVTASSCIAAVVFLGAFVWWERRTENPMLPMSLFGQRLFTISIVSVALVYAALMGVMFFLPQFLQLVQGLTPLQSGVAMLPGAMGLLLASLASPRIAQRVGTRATVVTGLVVVAAGMAVGAFFTESTPVLLVGGSLGLMGVGLGMVLPQATNGILASVPRERSGLGSAVNDGMSELGGSLGVALLGSLLALGYRNGIEGQIAQAGEAIQQVPEQVVAAVRESLASGLLAVARLPVGVADAVREAAAAAFVSGMTLALLAAAGIVLIGALLAWWLFPRQVEQVAE